MEARRLFEEKVIGFLYFLDAAREDGGAAQGAVARIDIRGDEGLAGACFEVKDLADGSAICLDPVDEEDARADAHGMVGVFALLTTVDGVTTAPEEVAAGDVLDGGVIGGEVQVESLTDEGRVGGLDGGVGLLASSLLCRIGALASREEKARRQGAECKQAHRLSR